MNMHQRQWVSLLLAGLVTIGAGQANTPDNPPVAIYTFKNGFTCMDCRAVDKEWGVTLLKPSLKGYYERLLRQSAAGGEHLTLEKPDKTVLKVSIHSLKEEESRPDGQAVRYNVSTFNGDRLKDVQKLLTNYQAMYFIFGTDSGEKVALPFQDVEYMVDAQTGRLLFDGNQIKAKVAHLINLQNQMTMTSSVIQQNMYNAQNRQALMLQAVKPLATTPISAPKTINCNTFGSNTTCTGW